MFYFQALSLIINDQYFVKKTNDYIFIFFFIAIVLFAIYYDLIKIYRKIIFIYNKSIILIMKSIVLKYFNFICIKVKKLKDKLF